MEIQVTTTPARRSELLSVARMILGPLSAQPGCVSCDCFVGIDDGPLLLSSEWQTESALRAYVASEGFRMSLQWMELSAETPEVRVLSLLHPNAMSVISSIRAACDMDSES